MIEVSRVSKSFGATRAVDDVSLTLIPGVVAGLLGPNGAGKTTLIRIITSYLSPSSGRVTVCGNDTVQQSQAARSSLGYLPESAPLYPEMSVDGYLGYRARLFGVPRSRRRAALESAVERCWLSDVRKKRIGHLSKGYRQRVGLAAAILHDPRVLVLDEPTSGLDPAQITMMRGLIRDLATDRVVLLSSHILSEVELTCGRVVIVTQGRVRADGTPGDLIARFDRDSRYEIAFAAGTDPAKAENLIRSVAGAHTVTRIDPIGAGPNAPCFVVTPTSAAPDLREPLALAAMRAGLLVRELTRSRASLERVFMSILEQRGGDGTGVHP